MYAIGYDLGSSSIKAALVEVNNGKVIARIQEPATEMSMDAPQAGWAEQDPESWWGYACAATKRIIEENNISPDQIQSVGISYQMHGLVLVDDQHEVVRPSIIWCDSRAVELGEASFQRIGPERCLTHCLNSPGNFTAAKLKWVQENEPDNYARARYAMLPGDYLALKLSGEATTTATGLSEGVLWDFKAETPASLVMDDLELDQELLPTLVPAVGKQATVSADGAAASGLPAGIIIGYRAGDQPNNALSLNALAPGEVAATAGTSGVVYGVTDRLVSDPEQRVNSFAHVNHTTAEPRIGVLLCINGAGILHRWIRQNIGGKSLSYGEMEVLADKVAVGANGLSFIPFGNGTERMFGNQQIGAHLLHLDLNRHEQGDLIRAGIEGIAFAFVYGMRIMKGELGMDLSMIRVGNDNLFQSKIFANTIATLSGATIEVHNTTGAVGAAMAGAAGAGLVDELKTAMARQQIVERIEPTQHSAEYEEAYARWLKGLSLFQ
ncbi:carbohydrate kinase [Lewinellaceae bacterium SD302]|nr:carbohydrate kinase [Lewinellaceae bacterium SD302]